MKKTLCLLLCLLTAASLCSAVYAGGADRGMVYDEVEYAEPQDIFIKNIRSSADGSIHCVTNDGPEYETIDTSKGHPEHTKTKVFTHNFYNYNGSVLLATGETTVTGVYSQYDNYARITGITTTFTGSMASHFSYSTTISGDTGYLYIKYDDVTYVTIGFRIYTNGSIQQI